MSIVLISLVRERLGQTECLCARESKIEMRIAKDILRIRFGSKLRAFTAALQWSYEHKNVVRPEFDIQMSAISDLLIADTGWIQAVCGCDSDGYRVDDTG
jgi:hypothetical protein